MTNKSDPRTFMKAYHAVMEKTHHNGFKLTQLDKNIYNCMLSFKESNLPIQPSYQYLSNTLGSNRSSVERSVKNLEQAGIIGSTQRLDNSKLYTVLVDLTAPAIVVEKASAPAAEPAPEEPAQEAPEPETEPESPEPPVDVVPPVVEGYDSTISVLSFGDAF